MPEGAKGVESPVVEAQAEAEDGPGARGSETAKRAEPFEGWWFAPPALVLFVVLAPILTMTSAGCAREVRAEFPRPPVTASIPMEPESEPAEAPEAPESAAQTAEAPEPEAEPEVEPEPVPPPPRRRARSSPPKAEPPEQPEPPPTPRRAEPAVADPALVQKLVQADSLIASVDARPLSLEARDQVNAARAFIAQAREALDEGDERRALILVDKGLILAVDIERASRP